MAQRSKFIGAPSRYELWAPQVVAMGSSPVTPTIFYESIHLKVSAFLLAVGPEAEGPGITTEALTVREQLKNICIVDYFLYM